MFTQVFKNAPMTPDHENEYEEKINVNHINYYFKHYLFVGKVMYTTKKYFIDRYPQYTPIYENIQYMEDNKIVAILFNFDKMTVKIYYEYVVKYDKSDYLEFFNALPKSIKVDIKRKYTYVTHITSQVESEAVHDFTLPSPKSAKNI